MKSINDINAMSEAEFLDAFGDVAEDSPWFAEYAGAKRPFEDRQDMINAFLFSLRNADEQSQLALLRAHPDLASRAKLTADSTREQKGAGLDTLSQAEFDRFTDLNSRYKRKFGFPFIFAVKGATKHQILESFEARIGNSKAQEFETALLQVGRIVRFRIEDRVAP